VLVSPGSDKNYTLRKNLCLTSTLDESAVARAAAVVPTSIGVSFLRTLDVLFCRKFPMLF
jgi:hypothetical protein